MDQAQKNRTVAECLGDERYGEIKALSTQHKVAIPEIIARFVVHAMLDQDLDVADLLSDAPKASRGRRPLSDDERAKREALRGVKGVDKATAVKALQAAIDGLVRAS